MTNKINTVLKAITDRIAGTLPSDTVKNPKLGTHPVLSASNIKSSPPASEKAVEEICVTCGDPHPYHQCLATDGNVSPEYRDNIQGYVSAAAGNYNQADLRKLWGYYMDYQCTQPSEIEICRQAEEIERQREIKEQNRVHEETMQMLREMIKIQEEKRIYEEAARQEEEKRIAKEKEAAELEAKHKIQECLNIEEKSIPQASTRSRKFRIDPTLRNFTISTKRIPFSTVETVNSLKMGDKHLDTHKKVHLNLVLKILFQSQVSPTFLGEPRTCTDPIPPGVVDTDSEPEEEIRLAENLSYDNSSPRPPEERNSEIADTIVESLSPPPIPVEDSDSLMDRN
ncbi:hypothetical protein Tco_0233591 [Tanacetum coccineum]